MGGGYIPRIKIHFPTMFCCSFFFQNVRRDLDIRQSFRLQIYGRTMAGKAVATQPISIAFNFFCNGQ